MGCSFIATRFFMPIPLLTEEYLFSLHVNDLIQLHSESLQGLLELSKFPYNKFEFASKGKEVALIQRILVAKRADS